MPRNKTSRRTESDAPDGWGFLNNYTRVVILIASNPLILQRVIAERIGITERAVQRIVADLEKAGYLIRQRAGRSNRYEMQLHRKLCDQACGHVSLGEFIRLLQE
jgi:uncharacterized membrane protein